MSSNHRGTPSGPRRGQTQRIASGARAAPYSRPEASRANSSGEKQWPPHQISIRGTSGPTWIVVANLLRGTTEADIHETFQQFGEIEGINLRKAPSENHPSIAFEIAFTSRASANIAIEKLDGALADGRLLQVTFRDVSKFTSSTEAIAASSPSIQTPPASVTNNRELLPTIPSGPKNAQQPKHSTGRELLNQRAQQSAGQGKLQPVKAVPVAAAPSLQSRFMSAAQLKALQKQQARASANQRVVPGVPTGPKGSLATQASKAAVPLSKRITLPLAMRLSEEAKRNGPASSQASAGPSKKRKAKAKAKAKITNGMDVD